MSETLYATHADPALLASIMPKMNQPQFGSINGINEPYYDLGDSRTWKKVVLYGIAILLGLVVIGGTLFLVGTYLHESMGIRNKVMLINAVRESAKDVLPMAQQLGII